jgi:hypothetical protein
MITVILNHHVLMVALLIVVQILVLDQIQVQVQIQVQILAHAVVHAPGQILVQIHNMNHAVIQ